MNVPTDLKYTDDHEWIRIDGDEVTIGITDYAQGELGDVVFVELPGAGDNFAKGDVAATIEAVKTVADVFLPLTGEVTEVNAVLEDQPETINEDAFGAGWILKMKLGDPGEADALLDAAAYSELIA